MKKMIIISSMLLLLVASSLIATETRVLTMGDNNMILIDEHNIHLFPSRINDWPNLAVSEFGSGDFTKFGVHWTLGGDDNPWYLATYFNNNSTALPSIIASIPFASGTILPNKRADFFYGRMLGESQFGMHFGMVHSSQREDNPGLGSKDDESFGMYSLDFGLTLNEGLMDISLGIDILSFRDIGTDTSGAAFNQTEAKGNKEFHFMARRFYTQSDTYTLIPHISLISGKYEADYFTYDIVGNTVDASKTDKYTVTSFDLGCGIEYQPAKNVLAVIDVGFSVDKTVSESVPASGSGSLATESSSRSTAFPYFKVGFDADVFKWMDIRMGTTSYWRNDVFEDVSARSESIDRFADNQTYLGFGFHWNRLHVDTYTDPGLFLNGFDFISGSGSGNMNFRISAVYEMM